MKKVLSTVLLIGLLFSMAAAKTNAKKDTKAPSAAAAKSQDFDGWVSDEKCGAKVDAECSKKCQAAGAKMVFVTPERAVIPVANQETLKNFAGQHVNIKGKLDNGVLSVDSVKPAAK
ncbi:MAG TPA: hypothetical protein VFQ41_05800 [Candidatus Angelobacter sp.]|nr:hypothetical protein [Candidatus Angelobacter sp.]